MNETRVRQETFYVVQRQFNRDVVDVFVIRYTWGGEDRPLKAEHLRPPNIFDGLIGAWAEHGDGEVLEPCLSIPGVLAHLLRTTAPYSSEEQTQAEQTVEQLIARVLGGRRSV